MAAADTFNWTDRGCSVAPRCLDCPLPRCRYDAEASMGSSKDDDTEIIHLLVEGMSQRQIAFHTGKSLSSVERQARRLREYVPRRAQAYQTRAAVVQEVEKIGKPVQYITASDCDVIARNIGVTRRSVYRYLRQIREGHWLHV